MIGSMSTNDERCDTTDLPVAMCACPRHGGVRERRKTETVHPPRRYDGDRPPKDAILVSKAGIAHHYGCEHLPDYEYLIPPDWGWIKDPREWQRIGSHQVPATEGNTTRIAGRRCLDCDW